MGSRSNVTVPVDLEGVYANHMYVVTGVGDDAKGRFIELFNPHNRVKRTLKSRSQRNEYRLRQTTFGESPVHFHVRENEWNTYFQTVCYEE